jgi:hypothetical protein
MLKRELTFTADPKGLAWRDSSSQVLKCDCEGGSCVMGVGRQMEAVIGRIAPLSAAAGTNKSA